MKLVYYFNDRLSHKNKNNHKKHAIASEVLKYIFDLAALIMDDIIINLKWRSNSI